MLMLYGTFVGEQHNVIWIVRIYAENLVFFNLILEIDFLSEFDNILP